MRNVNKQRAFQFSSGHGESELRDKWGAWCPLKPTGEDHSPNSQHCAPVEGLAAWTRVLLQCVHRSLVRLALLQHRHVTDVETKDHRG